MYLDTECTFTLLPEKLVENCIVYRYPHRTRYIEAFGGRDGSGVICYERALIEVQVKSFSGKFTTVYIEGNLTNHPGANCILIASPMVDRFYSGVGAIMDVRGHEVLVCLDREFGPIGTWASQYEI